ncbi:hypothetical protein BURK2_02917 [Burkholderiales bacterium]|nr:hypothetical protein BURK2_02917 [Burkholderiales bacterium]
MSRIQQRIAAAFSALVFALPLGFAAQDPQGLPGQSAEVYRRAQAGRWFAEAAKLRPEIFPTADQQSFVVAWKAPGTHPKHWIVSLHGSRGYATDDLALWYPTLKDRDLGFLGAQWWIGTDDSARSYYPPLHIYREIDFALQRLGVLPGTAMLHGFSRGATNAYAVAAIDAGQGRRYFSLAVASSGGVATDYPPTQAILAGSFGVRPLRDTRWITVAGARDPQPDRDGIAAMRRTAAWLEEQGAAVIERIEDPKEGHGALQRNVANARRVFELFMRGQAPE